jgi:copper homeostasis protein (lipoprotein)
MIKRSGALLVCMLLASACSQPQVKADGESKAVAQGASLVQSQTLYAGELPCADCAGIAYEIDFRDGGIFFLRTTYRGKEPATPQYQFGKWALAGNQLTLTMLGGNGGRELFAVVDAITLRKLDDAGKPIQSTLNYSLTRKDVYTPIEPTLRLSGMYLYRADASTFTECLTGITVPVAEEGDHADLRTAYTVARKESGQSVFVEMDGRIAWRPALEGTRKLNTLVVDKVGQFFPLRACEGTAVIHELETTRWVPTIIGTAPLILPPQQREPFIVLQAKRVTGYGGCNQLSGGYEHDARALKFTQIAATRMACEQGSDIEQALLKAIESTAAWRITGDKLELLDSAGNVLAGFVARNL